MGASVPLPKNGEPWIRKPHSHRLCPEHWGRKPEHRAASSSPDASRTGLSVGYPRRRGSRLAHHAASARGMRGDSPRPDPVSPAVVAGRSQLCQVGARGSAGTYLGGQPGSPRPSCSSSCGAEKEKADVPLAPLRSRHPPPRVRPLCEPAALWLRSLWLARARRRRAEEPERTSRGLWRPLAAARCCAGRRTAPPPLVPHSWRCGYPHLFAGLKQTFRPKLVRDS